MHSSIGAFTEQNYKNWKQFTTLCCIVFCICRVLLLNKITKIESNSQQQRKSYPRANRCFYWTKLQKLKAIHNMRVPRLVMSTVLLLNKITKIESNSQRLAFVIIHAIGCFYWTKLQKLKAIHNNAALHSFGIEGAFTEQNYKNWKQFTTKRSVRLLMIVVLLLNKITKIESNSQQSSSNFSKAMRCFYWTKLQKLKAIHNIRTHLEVDGWGAFTEQNYKNWKQFTTRGKYVYTIAQVLLLNKITKIESNSQHRDACW